MDKKSKKYYDLHYKNDIPLNVNNSFINLEDLLIEMLEVSVKQSQNRDAIRMLNDIGIKC